MSPATRESIIRQALKVIIEGTEGSLADRIDTIVRQLETLSPLHRTDVAKRLKGRLGRALRSRSAIITGGDTLPTEVAEKLDTLARAQGALTVEHRTDPTLLAGFQYQHGDDRTDLSLLKNLRKF